MRSDTRERIQAAAVGLFARKGFAATSVRDIAHEAGISTGLIYRHYATKEALFDDLVSQAADGLDRVARTFGRKGSPAEPIREFVREFVDDLVADGGFAEFVLVVNQAITLPDPSPQTERLMERHRVLIDRTARLIERGQRRGEFVRGDASGLATCLFALLGGLAAMKFTVGRDFRVPDVATVTALLIEEDRR